MNEYTNFTDAMDPRIAEALTEEPLPRHLHGRIMKRVFLAGYGKYLALSGGVLILNLGVLGANLYQTFSSASAEKALFGLEKSFAFSPSYLAAASETLYNVLPIGSIVATGLALAVSAYIATVFVRVYRNPHGVKLVRE